MNDLDLSAYLDGRLQVSERDRMEAHMAECADCRQKMLASRRLIRAAGRPRRSILTAGALIAAGVVTLMVTPLVRDRVTGPLVMRDAGDVQALIAYGPSGETSVTKPLLFSWAAAGGATVYRFTLAAAGGTPVWNTSVSDTTLSLPDSVRLTIGSRYVWIVDALLGTGATRSTGFREFQLTP